MDLLRLAHPDSPVAEMAFTDQLLHEVATGARPATARVFQPGPTVAFGRSDQHRPGYLDAQAAARSHGRVPVLRLGGGHACAYDADSVIVELIAPSADLFAGNTARFRHLTQIILDALARLGVLAEVGELPGEYCPGRFSLHLPDGPKIAGVAQRSISGAALTTAVVVAGGGPALRGLLADVYPALGLETDVTVAGAIAEHHPDLDAAQVADAIAEQVTEVGVVMPA